MNIVKKGKKILIRKSRKFIGTDRLEAVLDRMAVITDIYIPAYAQHQKVFPKYKGIYKGKDIVLVGTGPTLEYYSPMVNAIHIGVNSAIFKDKLKLDYLFMCDFDDGIKYFEKVFSLQENTTNFFGVNYRRKNALIPEYIMERENVEMFYVDSFDYSFFGNEFGKIGKIFYPLDISVSPMKSYGTTMFCAFQFALWTHPKRIYIVGADCSLGGHAEGIGYSKTQNDFDYSYLVEPWKMSKEFSEAFYPDVEIFSVNPVGLKGIFNDIFTEDL